MREELLYQLLALEIRNRIKMCRLDPERLQEIRMRIHQPLFLRYDAEEYVLTEQGSLSKDTSHSYRVTGADMKETLSCVSGYSLYAFDEEMRRGFITVAGGHRVGVAGKTVMEDWKVQCMRHISFMNIRLAHQVIGCADCVLPYIAENNEIHNTLIISPPGCGKTTILRDLIRQISDGTTLSAGKTVGLIDERSEIAGCYQGVPQNDIGMRTDVLDCCRKTPGIEMLLRSMAPQVIAVDEIGSAEDEAALEGAQNCGCRLIATMHGSSLSDIGMKAFVKRIMEKQMFERFIVLGAGKAGYRQEVFDPQGTRLYQSVLQQEKE